MLTDVQFLFVLSALYAIAAVMAKQEGAAATMGSLHVLLGAAGVVVWALRNLLAMGGFFE